MFSFSDRVVTAGFVVAALLVTGHTRAQELKMVTDPSTTIYGERARAPRASSTSSRS